MDLSNYTNELTILEYALIFLGAAMFTTPVFRKLGLGSVLGYLFAGIILGPVTQIVSSGEAILHFSELGIVFLLFVIGLELTPARLWSLRGDIFGLGSAQVLVTSLIFFTIFILLGYSWQVAIILAFGLALSSTAFAMQILTDKKHQNTIYGRKSFSILLFQDLAIVPLLALVTLLAPNNDLDSIGWDSVALAIGAIVALLFAGKFILDPLFEIIAATKTREAMLSTALFVVIGSALLMYSVGLSMAIGAFISGVMMAESSFRHQLKADIEPFRGLLLGLFFVACGLSFDLSSLFSNWAQLILLVPTILIVKVVCIYVLSRLLKNLHKTSLRTAALLSQGGEFGFVLFTAAATNGLWDNQFSSLLIAAIIISMALTPLIIKICETLIKAPDQDVKNTEVDNAEGEIIIVGLARFGQVVAQSLLAHEHAITAIDKSVQAVGGARELGFNVYFGDGSRSDILEAAGVKNARAIVICTHDVEVTNQIVRASQQLNPDIAIFVRSYDEKHSLELHRLGVQFEVQELVGSAHILSAEILTDLGTSQTDASALINTVKQKQQDELIARLDEDPVEAEERP